jgi:acyl-CoA synthetase
LGEPELTAKSFDRDGWYYGGDLCLLDSDGYIKIVGRKKDIIIRGGENISCREVEDLLYAHPDVEEASLVARPDERLGERACACVVLREGKQLSLKDIQSYLETHGVAKYKWPEGLAIVDSLPKTASGKVQKFILREEINKVEAQVV